MKCYFCPGLFLVPLSRSSFSEETAPMGHGREGCATVDTSFLIGQRQMSEMVQAISAASYEKEERKRERQRQRQK